MRILNTTTKNHSSIRLSNFKIDSLGITLQNSNAYIDLITKKVYGTLSDSSRINIRQPEEICMKSDTTSNIYIYDWD